MWKNQSEDLNLNSVSMKAQFYQFIEHSCKDLIEKYKLKQEKYYDAVTFNETLKLMENYYKLDPKLRLLTERNPEKLWKDLIFLIIISSLISKIS